jgi:hypothetical protein
MSQHSPAKTKPPQRAQPQKRRARGAEYLRRRNSSLERRLKATGLDAPDTGDIEDIRRRLTRRIAMVNNRWHGCPEPICRRNRGCMAPRIVCANIPPRAPADEERRVREIQAALRKALQARRGAHGAGLRAGRDKGGPAV